MLDIADLVFGFVLWASNQFTDSDVLFTILWLVFFNKSLVYIDRYTHILSIFQAKKFKGFDAKENGWNNISHLKVLCTISCVLSYRITWSSVLPYHSILLMVEGQFFLQVRRWIPQMWLHDICYNKSSSQKIIDFVLFRKLSMVSIIQSTSEFCLVLRFFRPLPMLNYFCSSSEFKCHVLVSNILRSQDQVSSFVAQPFKCS